MSGGQYGSGDGSGYGSGRGNGSGSGSGSGYGSGRGNGSGSGSGSGYGIGSGSGSGYGIGSGSGRGIGIGSAIILRDIFSLSFNFLNNQSKGNHNMKQPNSQHPDFGKYVIMRDKEAGVAAGNFISLDEKTKVGVLANARRIWYWEGAASLSQLAQEGTSKPKECKFPCEVTAVKFLNVAEMLYVSPKAEKCIKAVPIWKE